MNTFLKYFLLAIYVCTFFFSAASPSFAAQVRTGESIYLSETQKGLKDLYLFGSEITVDAPVTNDLITAGSSVTLNGDVTGSIMAAGSDVIVRSPIAHTGRFAGANVSVSGPVGRDVLIFASTAKVTKEASISGDLIVFGSDVIIDAPVQGNIRAYGESVTINSTVAGNVEGTMGTLILGSQAKINGNLSYQSDNKATIQNGAIVNGQQTHSPIDHQNKKQDERNFIQRTFTSGALYTIATDIVLTLLLVLLLPRVVGTFIKKAIESPVAASGIGFIFLVFWPLFSLFLLALLWLGIVSFISYALLVIIAMFFAKALLGWWVLHWWDKRSDKDYTLDWRAAVVGPAGMFLLLLIPVLGWIVAFILYLISLGALVLVAKESITRGTPKPLKP